MNRKFLALFAIISIGILLAGCRGSESSDNYAAEPEMDFMLEEESAGQGAGHNLASTVPQQRIVIMEANMTIETDNPVEVIAAIELLADWYQGYVVASTLENSYEDEALKTSSGTITIRVPAERLQDVIADIEAQDMIVLYKTVTGDDVTSDYVDLESRLRNLEETAIKLEEIMDDAEDSQSVLEVYKELVLVNEEAEVIRGRIQYYDEVSTMSALTVQAYRSDNAPASWTLSPAWQNTTQRLTTSFQNWLESLINFFIYFLPMFILQVGIWLVLIFLLVRWIYRKRKGITRKPKPKKTKTEKATPPQQSLGFSGSVKDTDYESLGEKPPEAQWMTTYLIGDDRYDDSFSIETDAGEFLGEFGISILDTIGMGEPRKVSAFEIWLFDTLDISTGTKVLLSEAANKDEDVRKRLEAKGSVSALLAVGEQYTLETAGLRMVAKVMEMQYGTDSTYPPNSYLERLTVELVAWKK